MIALNELVLIFRHAHITQVVEPELAVGAVGNVAVILFPAFGAAHGVLNTAHRQTEEPENISHPLTVTQGEVIVDRDELAVFAGNGVEVQGQRGNEGLTFTGRHFCDLALMERNTADQLHIEGDHVPFQLMPADGESLSAQSAAGIFDRGECLGQHGIQGFPVGSTLLELCCLGDQLFIREALVRNFQLVDLFDQRHHALDRTGRGAAEH